MSKKIKVVIVMGSKSDLKVMSAAAAELEKFGVGSQTQILSAHRTPQLLEESAGQWERDGVKVVIAGAGGAAHLPGMLASFSVLPVIGVPVASRAMNGLDALLSIAQMPKGVPVATVAVDNAVNAALLAAEILGAEDSGEGRRLRTLLAKYKLSMRRNVLKDRALLKRNGVKRFMSTQRI